MKYNLKLLPKEILIELLNKETGNVLVSKNIVFDNPINITGDVYNTLLVVYPKSYNNFSGTFSFKYNRLDIRTYIPSTKKLTFNHEQKLSDIVTKLNEEYGLNITKEDYYDKMLPNMSYGDIAKLKIVMRPNSYIWMNSINLIVKKLPLLTEIFTNTKLNGFWKPVDIKYAFTNTKLNGFWLSTDLRCVFTNTKLNGFGYFDKSLEPKEFNTVFKNNVPNGFSRVH